MIFNCYHRMQIKLVSLWIVSSHQSSVIYADIIRNLESTWSWLIPFWRSASHIGHSNKFQPNWPAAPQLVWVFINYIYMLTGTAPLRLNITTFEKHKLVSWRNRMNRRNCFPCIRKKRKFDLGSSWSERKVKLVV